MTYDLDYCAPVYLHASPSGRIAKPHMTPLRAIMRDIKKHGKILTDTRAVLHGLSEKFKITASRPYCAGFQDIKKLIDAGYADKDLATNRTHACILQNGAPEAMLMYRHHVMEDLPYNMLMKPSKHEQYILDIVRKLFRGVFPTVIRRNNTNEYSIEINFGFSFFTVYVIVDGSTIYDDIYQSIVSDIMRLAYMTSIECQTQNEQMAIGYYFAASESCHVWLPAMSLDGLPIAIGFNLLDRKVFVPENYRVFSIEHHYVLVDMYLAAIKHSEYANDVTKGKSKSTETKALS